MLAEEDPRLPARVAELVLGRHELTYLARAVSGTVDVDRCDYLLRDAHATGVPYGRFDLDWLLRSLTFAPSDGSNCAPPLAIDGAKGICRSSRSSSRASSCSSRSISTRRRAPRNG